jgi:hypothetical protein
MMLGKAQLNLASRRCWSFRVDQACAISRKIAAEHASYVENRVAPAYQAVIMRAVANHITFGAQDSMLQGNRVEYPPFFGGTFDT